MSICFKCLCFNCIHKSKTDCTKRNKQVCHGDFCSQAVVCVDFEPMHSQIEYFNAYHKYQQAIKLLKEIEWIAHWNDINDWNECPCCGALDYNGHSLGCQLNKLVNQ